MVWTALLGVLFALLDAVLNAMPTWTAPTAESGFSHAVNVMGGAMHWLGTWLNVPLLLGAVAAWATLYATMYLARFALWVYGLIPGKSS
jgi:inner membrane protein involved in colicin E2 resistance